MVSGAKPCSEYAKERMALLMTSTKKAAYNNPARRIFLSLGQLFHETRTAYASATVEDRTDLDALDAGPEQLE